MPGKLRRDAVKVRWPGSTGKPPIWLTDGSTNSIDSPDTVGDLNWQITGMGDYGPCWLAFLVFAGVRRKSRSESITNTQTT